MKNALCVLGLSALAGFVAPAPADAHRQAIDLFDFNSNSGYAPWGGAIADAHGNLFGTTTIGGNGPCDGSAGCGTIYELSPSNNGTWTFSVLYNFQGGTDGSAPLAQLTLGPNGSLYGYSTGGGNFGTIFQLSPPMGGTGAWTFQALYEFDAQNPNNLEFVYAPLIAHGKAVFGIASGGSNACGDQGLGCGSLFKLTPPKSGTGPWNLKTLYAFAGGTSSGTPTWTVGPDANGAFYVSTSDGNGVDGNGAVVQLSPSGGTWMENFLTTFNGGSDGKLPNDLVRTADGTLYGVADTSKGALVFQIANGGNGWTRTNIATIANNFDDPYSLALASDGSLIGTVFGDFDFSPGNVFGLSQSGGAWTLRRLWNFKNGPDRNPISVTSGKGGHLFGVLNGGDYFSGSLFELK